MPKPGRAPSRTPTKTGTATRPWTRPVTHRPTVPPPWNGSFAYVCNASDGQGVLEVRVRSHTSTGGERSHAPVVLPDKLVRGASQGGRRGSPRGATSVAAPGGCGGSGRP